MNRGAVDNAATANNELHIVSILGTARRLITEGNPGQALQAVVTALKLTAGEAAVIPALKRAHEHYQSQAKSSAAANELSALFAECAIAEASERLSDLSSSEGSRNMQDMVASSSSSSSGACAMDCMDAIMETGSSPHSKPILAESGRMQVVTDASSDGSSFVCAKCGGVVSNSRRDEHLAFWCMQAPPY